MSKKYWMPASVWNRSQGTTHFVKHVGVPPGGWASRCGLQRAAGRRDRGGEPVEPGHRAARAGRAQGRCDSFGRGCVDGDNDVIGGQALPVGQLNLYPRPAMGRIAAGDPRGHKATHPCSDESHTELDQVPVPVVEPCFGGGTVEHPVGFVVVAVRLQL